MPKKDEERQQMKNEIQIELYCMNRGSDPGNTLKGAAYMKWSRWDSVFKAEFLIRMLSGTPNSHI